MAEADHIRGVQSPGRYDAGVGSGAEARRIVQQALPHAVELPPAVAGLPDPGPPPGVKAWFQVHPAEPGVGHDPPPLKYADWTGGKKGAGGRWGHLFFPPASAEENVMSAMVEVLYRSPSDPGRESAIADRVGLFGGRLTYREEPDQMAAGPVCLTFESRDLAVAEEAAVSLRSQGEHVEGPSEYGD